MTRIWKLVFVLTCGLSPLSRITSHSETDRMECVSHCLGLFFLCRTFFFVSEKTERFHFYFILPNYSYVLLRHCSAIVAWKAAYFNQRRCYLLLSNLIKYRNTLSLWPNNRNENTLRIGFICKILSIYLKAIVIFKNCSYDLGLWTNLGLSWFLDSLNSFFSRAEHRFFF